MIEAPIPEDEPVSTARPGEPRAVATLQTEPNAAEQPAADVAKTAADELSRARELLVKHASIQANIVETVSIFDRSYKAEGRYLQQGVSADDWHLRLELSIKVGDSSGTLTEVCDGDVLWTSTLINSGRKSRRKEKPEKPDNAEDRRTDGKPDAPESEAAREKSEHALVRCNVKEILAAARKRGEKTETMLIASLGLGGMPTLLAAIQQDMIFRSVSQATLRDRPVTVIEGTWSDTFLAQFRNPNQPEAPGSALLPPFVPDSVSISLDRETGFPVRFVYRKKMPNRDVQRDMLVLDFLDVAIDQPMDKSDFVFVPPTGVQQRELTPLYLERIGTPDAGPPAGGPPPQ